MHAFSIGLHIIAIVLWLGSALLFTRIAAIVARRPETSPELRSQVAGASKRYLLIGLALATVTGLYQVTALGVEGIMKQGWFHGKLTLVLILYVLTFFILKGMRRFADSNDIPPGRFMMLHGFAGIILLSTVFLMTFAPHL